VFVIPKTRNLNEETEMVRNKWTRKEQQKLDKIESSLVKKGVPEHQARFMAEPDPEAAYCSSGRKTRGSARTGTLGAKLGIAGQRLCYRQKTKPIRGAPLVPLFF
jgi:hypothetical protein